MGALAARPLISFLVIVSLTAGALWFAFDMGVDHERAKWQKANSDQLAKVYEKVLKLKNEKYDLEQRLRANAANVQNLMNVRIKQNEARKNTIKHDHAAGAMQLRLPTSTCAAGDRDRASSTASSVRRDDAGARCRLSQSDAGFLIDLAAEADAIAIKLTACQRRLRLCTNPKEAL